MASAVVILLATVGASWASYHFLEKKINFSPLNFQPQNMAVLTLTLVVPVAAVFGWHYGSNQYQNFLLSAQLVTAIPGDIGQEEYREVVSARSVECVNSEIRESSLWCRQSSGNAPVEIAIIGDSHAEHLLFGLSAAKPGTEIAYYARTELPVPGSSSEMAKILGHVVESQSIRIVILSVFWLHRGVPATEMVEVVETLQSAGKSVFLTNDVPYFAGRDVAACRVSAAINAPRRCDFEPFGPDQTASLNETLRAITSATGATFVDTYGLFCQDRKCSMSGRLSDQLPEALFFRDESHLNSLGSIFVGRELARYLLPTGR